MRWNKMKFYMSKQMYLRRAGVARREEVACCDSLRIWVAIFAHISTIHTNIT